LIGQPTGAFQQAAQKRTDDALFVRGLLLLGETYLGLKEYRAGEEVMDRLAERNLPPESGWQRLYLLARLQLADQRTDSSVANDDEPVGPTDRSHQHFRRPT